MYSSQCSLIWFYLWSCLQIAFSVDYEKSEEMFNFNKFHASFRNISILIESLSKGVKENIHTSGLFQVVCLYKVVNELANRYKFFCTHIQLHYALVGLNSSIFPHQLITSHRTQCRADVFRAKDLSPFINSKNYRRVSIIIFMFI